MKVLNGEIYIVQNGIKMALCSSYVMSRVGDEYSIGINQAYLTINAISRQWNFENVGDDFAMVVEKPNGKITYYDCKVKNVKHEGNEWRNIIIRAMGRGETRNGRP